MTVSLTNRASRASVLEIASVLLMAAMALLLQASCARSIDSDADSDTRLLSPGVGNPAPLTVCVATDCPAPFATCRDGGLCKTDTSRDVDNCGGCGKECPKPTGALHATSVCNGGKCVYACDQLSADCNNNPADGCEVFTGDDPNNCGGCGLACKSGELCWKGACGCPTGFVQCGSECKKLDSDNLACGACDKKCTAPPNNDPEWKCGPGVQPTSTGWACEGGTCKITCERFYGDCNANLCNDGCETELRTDRLNCGSCGIVCAAGQDCVDGTCLCPPGTTRCGKRCIDVDVDPNNCGGCGIGCPGAGDSTGNGSPLCKNGSCSYVCFAGFADCNNNKNDGCEVEVGTDPLNCGGCGTKCDTARGQPCIGGKCLTKPCEPGRGTL